MAGGEVLDKAPAEVMDVGSGCSSDGLENQVEHTLWKP